MNLQNLPRSDDVIKRAFLPKLDLFLFADYSSIEYRLLAYYVCGLGDDSIANEFRSGLDPHTATARVLYQKEDITDEERQSGKTFNFSTIYGGGTPTIIRQLGCSEAEARALLHRFHEGRPGIRALQSEVSDTLRGRGFTRTPWGRHLHSHDDHRALNSLIQGSAADLLRDAMRKTHRWLSEEEYTSHMTVSVHDELGLDCTSEEEVSILEHLPELMGNEEIEEIVPIEIEIKRSERSWADAEPIRPI